MHPSKLFSGFYICIVLCIHLPENAAECSPVALQASTTLPHSASVTALSWMKDGRHLVTASEDSKVQIWDVDSKHNVLDLNGPNCGLMSLDSNDSQDLVAGGGAFFSKAGSTSCPGKIWIWNNRTGDCVRELTKTAAVYSVSWDHIGRHLVSGSWDKKVRLWRVERPDAVHEFPHPSYVYAVRCSPQDNRLASASAQSYTSPLSSKGIVNIWDMNTLARISSITASIQRPSSVCWSPDSLLLATTSNGRKKEHLHIWDLRQIAQPLHALEVTKGGLCSSSFNSDSRHIALGSAHGEYLFIVDAVTGELIKESKHKKIMGDQRTRRTRTVQNAVNDVEWKPKDQILASASTDSTVRLWDLNQGNGVHEQQARAHEVSPSVSSSNISAAAACAPKIGTGAESRRVSGVGYASIQEIMGQRQRLRASTVQNDGPSKNVDEPEFMKARRSLSSCKRLSSLPESQSQSPESLPVVEQLDLGTTPANVLQSSSRSALLPAVHQRTRARSCESPSRPKGPPCPPPDAPQANSSTSRLALCAAIEQGVQLNKIGATGGRHQRSKSQLAVALESVRDQIAPQDEGSDNDVEEEEWQED